MRAGSTGPHQPARLGKVTIYPVLLKDSMKNLLSRRRFGSLFGKGAALGAAAPFAAPLFAAQAQPPASPAPVVPGSFPSDFLWGTATASYQVEGSTRKGGRGPSIWDTFSHTAAKISHGDTGDIADDFVERYQGDVRLMADLGVRGFRFSVAWPRVFPQGTGQPNPQGMDFYLRLVEELHQHGIEPFCTLYHWDLPQAVQDRGGWESPETAEQYAAYAGYAAGRLSRAGVRSFLTMNEIRTFVELGYGTGVHAPGLQVGRKRLAQLTHNVLLGQGMGVQAIRAQAAAGVRVGLAENPVAVVPVTQTAEDVSAARVAMREENAAYLTAICEGRYTDRYLQELGPDAPRFTSQEMRTIGSPLDMLGLNIYTPTYVRAAAAPAGYERLKAPADFPHMASTWLTIGPESIRWACRLTHELWKPKAIYITENGCSAEDVVTPDGEVLDSGRVMYLRNYLAELSRAAAEGVPIKGYFLWSLLDNFEWADGYGKRFGIVYVDFSTQKRTTKLSAQFYRSVIRSNGLGV